MPKTKATFIEPMLLLGTEKLPQGADWSYEIKLDGYRALAIKSGGKVQLRSLWPLHSCSCSRSALSLRKREG